MSVCFPSQYTSKAPKHIQSQISVAPFPHTWAQTSIIVKFTPTSKEGKKAPITIVSQSQAFLVSLDVTWAMSK